MKKPLFRKLSQLRAFQRKALPFLVTAVDVDILLAIGRAGELSRPLGTTDLFYEGFAPTATLYRRLRRLRNVGAVIRRRSSKDRRRIELHVSASVSRTLRQLLTLRG